MFQRLRPYLLNAGFLTVLLLCLAIILEVAPFGKHSLLTIDLSQQYIDFFSLYKDTWLHHPEQLFYSFGKAIGGEMIGLWAYYLTSPFNWILLLLADPQLIHGVTVLTYLKLIAMSLTMMYFIRQRFRLPTIPTLIASYSYALMSYTMVYLLNIMWLDGLVLLPLIALGLERLIRHQRPNLYIVSLAVALIANYYIGFMISIFLAFYAWFVILTQPNFTWRQSLIRYGRFIYTSLISVAISAALLVPTFHSLLSNKGSYMEYDFDWATAHSVADVFSKIFIGSYNSDEMSSGSPNLYIGSLMLLLAVNYFLTREIHWREKLGALGILGVFMAAFHFETIDRIWHGGQFPIWYHFRFSFTFGFFLIVLSLHTYPAFSKRFPRWQGMVLAITMIALGGFYYWRLADYEFLNQWKILGTVLIALLFIAILLSQRLPHRVKPYVLIPLVIVELFTNASLILSQINHVQVSKFDDYVKTLDDSLDGLRNSSNDFYRIHTTFQRTKNEAFFTHYNGLDHFGSTIEANVPLLYGYLGLPNGNGFVNYSNGTLFTDDFFNVRYIIDPSILTRDYTSEEQYVLFQQATDMDLQAYPIVHEAERFVIHENSNRLGLGFEVSPEVFDEDTTFKDHRPINNQELLLNLLDFNQEYGSFYTEHPFQKVTLTHVEEEALSDSGYTRYTATVDVDESEPDKAKIRYYFDVLSKNPHYFTLPSQLNAKNSQVKLNNENYRVYFPYQKRQITNASYGQIKDNQFLDILLKDEELEINPPHLYEFDETAYQALINRRQDNNFEIKHFSHTNIQGNIQMEQDQGALLFTIPYDDNWQVTVNESVVEPLPVLNDTLMAIPLAKGHHEITLKFFPKAVIPGLVVSGIGGLAFIGLNLRINRREKLLS